MADAPDIAELDRRALVCPADVLARIVIRGSGYHADRLSSELRALARAPRLPGLHVKIDGETGRWSANSDAGSASGRGFTSLVSTIADVPIQRAAAWLAQLPQLVEPSL